MSRADAATIPKAPRLLAVLRTAGSDLYFHGVRLIIVNVVWGLSLLAAGYLLLRSPLGPLALVLLVPLTAALMGMATRLVRERTLVMSDAWDAVRIGFWRHLGIGVAQIAFGLVAYVDLLIGIGIGGLPGLVLAVIAAEAAIALWLLAVSTWPILLDPVRVHEPIRSRLRLGALLLIAHPVRIGGVAVGIVLFLALSTLLAAAIVTVSGAYAFLVAAHWVLPAADRLEGRRTAVLDD